MPRMKDTDRLEQLKKEEQQIAARRKAVEAKIAEQSRKDETRRKIVAGALALEHMEKNPQDPVTNKMRELLDKYVLPRDRHLFPTLPTAITSSGNEFGNG